MGSERLGSNIDPFEASRQDVNRAMTRRRFLMGAGGVAAGVLVGASAKNYFFDEQNAYWQEASLENDEFLDRNSDKLSHIKFGASFSPEVFFGSYSPGNNSNMEFSEYEAREKLMLDSLDMTINEFGIKDLRLGIRWNQAVDSDNISLDFYRPVLEKCMKEGVDITLNCGPIKTFRWPEEHVPQQIMEDFAMPPHSGVVSVEDELAKHATGYLENLFFAIDNEFGHDALKNIKTIQPENEGYQPFGEKRWTVSDEYYTELIGMIHEFFPDASVLINSAGLDHLPNIRNLYQGILNKHIGLEGKLKAGIDFYFDTPSRLHMHGIEPAVDPITEYKMKNPFARNPLDIHMSEAEKMEVETEFSEEQTEEWGSITHPIEKAQGMRFWMIRTAKYTNGMQRIWGIEELARRAVLGELTVENYKNVNLIQQTQEKVSLKRKGHR